MKPDVFFSYHFDGDSWRAGQVRNMGVVAGNEPVSAAEWDGIREKGDDNIRRWINEKLIHKACTIVLVGTDTYSRPWINYEINRSWELKKGVVGICIHNLRGEDSSQSKKGFSPFSNCSIKLYDPPYTESKAAYDHIYQNIGAWVEEAIKIRKSQP